MRLLDGVADTDWDAVSDWLGVREVVCEALGAHVCWMAESRMARNDASALHVPAPSAETKLPYAEAAPVTGGPLMLALRRLNAGVAETRSE